MKRSEKLRPLGKNVKRSKPWRHETVCGLVIKHASGNYGEGAVVNCMFCVAKEKHPNGKWHIFKDMELATYRMPVTKIICDNSVKDMP